MSQTKAQLVGGVGFSTADSLTVHNGLAVTGVVTATSFSGDGSGLIGVASTDNIITGTAATFNGGVKVTNGLVVTGISTFNTAIDVNSHVEFQAGSGNSQLYMFDENAVNFGNSSDGRIIYNNSGNIVKFERSGSTGEIEIDAAPVTLQHSDSTKLQTSTTGVTVTGDISATTGTFTGNVTIGGTLTYDDVTNVDSIGLVTARSGVQFGLAGVGGSVSGTGNANFAGIVTATSLDASIAFWTLGADGSNHYTFTGPGDLSGDADPDLQLIRGQKYIFKNRSGGHPFRIQSTPNGSTGTAYNDGVTNNDAGNGTDLIFDVPFDAPSILYYQCTSHGSMGGSIYIGSSSGDDVNVGAAVTIYASSGIVSATSYYGSGANLTGINVSPSFSGIASGSLTNGQPVVITDDGKLMAITGEAQSTTIGSKAVFKTGSVDSTNGHGNVYDPDENKVIIAYCNQGDSDKLEYAIGTVGAGRTITFTTPVHIGNDGVNPRLAYDTNSNRVVVAYRDPNNSNYGTARVGTVASGGGSISWGTAVLYEGQYSAHNEIVFDATNNKIVIAYRNQGDSNKGTAIVGTVSGSSITFGSGAVFESGATSNIKMAFDENSGKILIMYVDDDDGNYCKAVVATVSGTSISFGSKTTFNANSSEYPTCVYFPPAQKVFCAVRNHTSNIVAKLATISGTSVSFGTAENVTSDGYNNYVNQAVYHAAAKKIYFSWRRSSGTSDTYYRIVKYSTTQASGIDFDAAAADTGYGQYYPSFGSYDPDTKQVVYSFVDPDTSSDGMAIVNTVLYSNTNLTSSNFIGISNAAYSNGDTATVQVPGAVDDAQTGLTTGAKIYADPTGILSTSAGNPSVVAGRAVSATELLISFA